MITRLELTRRLQALGPVVEIPEPVRRAHLATITRAVAQAPRFASAPEGIPLRKRLAAVTAAVVLSFPVAAMASTGAVPGDALYPVKRAIEPVLGLVDPRVSARHRVEELAALIAEGDSGARVESALEAAREAVASLDPTDPLWIELAELEKRFEAAAAEGEGPSATVSSSEPVQTDRSGGATQMESDETSEAGSVGESEAEAHDQVSPSSTEEAGGEVDSTEAEHEIAPSSGEDDGTVEPAEQPEPSDEEEAES